MLRRKEGFTLIELLIVILIIAILVAIALPLYLATQTKARKNTCLGNQRIIDGAINTFYTDMPETVQVDMAALLSSNYLKAAPKCQGNTYLFYQGLTHSSAYCTKDAAHNTAAQ
jgi:prepilin-type N-terminal cleavage/methylation domain-containing protein